VTNLRVHSNWGTEHYVADRASPPHEVEPPPSPRKYWTRQGIAEWLIDLLSQEQLTIVGIDHALSFPLRYFEEHQVPLDWPTFLDDFRRHWPADEPNVCVEFIRQGICGNGAARSGNARWKRLTERRTGSAKSVFHFDVPGSVAKSTHAGLPWVRILREATGDRVHFWPFDGWTIQPARSTVVEVYPALWSRSFESEGRTPDQQDAWSVAKVLRATDSDGSLGDFLAPSLTAAERETGAIEGWILGVL
jgi:hypothetical protein